MEGRARSQLQLLGDRGVRALGARWGAACPRMPLELSRLELERRRPCPVGPSHSGCAAARRFCASRGRAIVVGIGPALLLTLWQNLIMPNMIYRSAMVRSLRHFW